MIEVGVEVEFGVQVEDESGVQVEVGDEIQMQLGCIIVEDEVEGKLTSK